MYIKGYLQPTPGKNSLSANQVNWGVQMGNIKHNRHLHSRVTEEGKHLFSLKNTVFNTDHREDKNASIVPRYLLMHFSPDEFFHMHTVLISVSTKQSFSPALLSRILDVLWRWPWKDQRNGMKRNRIPVWFRLFGWWELLPWQELCWVTATLLSAHLHSIYRWERAE